jgi:hypothetical protein
MVLRVGALLKCLGLDKIIRVKIPRLNTGGKRAVDVPQVIECIPSKHEVLNSNSSTMKKNEKEGKTCTHSLSVAM